MCGIFGTISVLQPADTALLERQRDTMQHRGPDSSGSWLLPDQINGVGHRRLAIVDLTPGSHQPMIHRASGCVITFNVDINNYRALPDELLLQGRRFATSSDTEVILVAYAARGTSCVARLVGMFAFALCDPQQRTVLLARDRDVEKPLYHSQGDGQIAFASELKAQLINPRCPRHVRADALNQYLAYGYTTGDRSTVRSIRRVAPGSQAIVRLSAVTVATSPYWTLPSYREPERPVDAESLTNELHTLRRGAVVRQLQHDVPVGALLSGVVDSSLIAALAAEASSGPLATYTVRFPSNTAIDEGPFARLVASHLGSRPVEREAMPVSSELLGRLAEEFDEPMADSSMVPTFVVPDEIRRHATVAIGGDGGAEHFVGYRPNQQFIRSKQVRRVVPRVVRRAMAGVGARVIPDAGSGLGTLEGLAGELGESIASARGTFREDERAALSPALTGFDRMAIVVPDGWRAGLYTDRRTAVQRAAAVDFAMRMSDDVLVKVELAIVLSSLEVRAPFLDAAMVNFALGSVPDSLRATTDERKILLKRLGTRTLPKEIGSDAQAGPLHPACRLAGDDVASLMGEEAILNYRRGEADDHLGRWRWTAASMMRRLADTIVVPSQNLVNVIGNDRLIATAIHNFVRLDCLPYRRRVDRSPCFLSNRNLEPLYNLECSIRGFTKVHKPVPRAFLTIAGHGSDRARLTALVGDLGLVESVRFVGKLKNQAMRALYDAWDRYLNSPNIANVPGSVLDVFATGISVVTTDSGGIHFIVKDRVNGRMVRAEDHLALAAAALDVMNHPEPALARADSARAECERLYRKSTFWSSWEDHYLGLRPPPESTRVA